MEAGRFELQLGAHGLLRPLSAAELSDGTLRYLLLVAALLSPRPPGLMVLNEPETSLHPDLLAPLARLIGQAGGTTQIVVVSHSAPLIRALQDEADSDHDRAGQGLRRDPGRRAGPVRGSGLAMGEPLTHSSLTPSRGSERTVGP